MEPFQGGSSLTFCPGGGLLKKNRKSRGLEKTRKCEARIWMDRPPGVDLSPGGGQEVGNKSVPRPLGSWRRGWCGMQGDRRAKTATGGARGAAFLIPTLGPIPFHELLTVPGEVSPREAPLLSFVPSN